MWLEVPRFVNVQAAVPPAGFVDVQISPPAPVATQSDADGQDNPKTAMNWVDGRSAAAQGAEPFVGSVEVLTVPEESSATHRF
jgi:hypothetical protein